MVAAVFLFRFQKWLSFPSFLKGKGLELVCTSQFCCVPATLIGRVSPVREVSILCLLFDL